MKKFIVILVALMPMFVGAQTLEEVDSTQVDLLTTQSSRPCIFDSLLYVRVYQDSVIFDLLQDKVQGNGNGLEVMGWRVQVYSSNRQQAAKAEAEELQQKLEHVLPSEVYALYISPFWKVRIGNFLTYEDAKLFKDTLLVHYPYLTADTYIVKDQINVRK